MFHHFDQSGSRALWLIALGMALFLGYGNVPAVAEERLDQLRSEDGQIVVETNDVQLASAVLSATVETRKKLATILGLPATGTNRIFVRALPSAPDKEWQPPYMGALLHKEGLDFSIVLYVPGPRVMEEFVRTLTQVCLYEKILSNNATFRAGDTLPLLPLWLSEGTLQVLLTGDNRDWEKVVSRAKKLHKAPTLETVTQWQELSSDSIERMWQQAFSYYLVASLSRPGTARLAFQQWLVSADTTPGQPFSSLAALMPDEFAWRAQLEHSVDRSRDMIYSWEETADELDRAMSITLYGSGKEKDVTTTIDSLKPYKNHSGLLEAVKGKVSDLTDLQLRSSVLWQPTLSCYSSALMAIGNLKPPPKPPGPVATRGSKSSSPELAPQRAEYAELIALGKSYREQIQKQHELVGDYINWVVVTKSLGEQGSTFASYYELHKKLNDFQPRQKDRIGRTVLKIENASN